MYYWNQITSIASNYFYQQNNLNQNHINSYNQNQNSNNQSNLDHASSPQPNVDKPNTLQNASPNYEAKKKQLNAELERLKRLQNKKLTQSKNPIGLGEFLNTFPKKTAQADIREYLGSTIHQQSTLISHITQLRGPKTNLDKSQYHDSLKPHLVDRGYTYRRVMGDGNCFFYSITYALLRNAIETNRVGELVTKLERLSRPANNYLGYFPEFNQVPKEEGIDRKALQAITYLQTHPKEFYQTLNNHLVVDAISSLLRKILGNHILKEHAKHTFLPTFTTEDVIESIQVCEDQDWSRGWGDMETLWAFNKLFENNMGRPLLCINTDIDTMTDLNSTDPQNMRDNHIRFSSTGNVDNEHRQGRTYQPLNGNTFPTNNPPIILHNCGGHYGIFEKLTHEQKTFDQEQQKVNTRSFPNTDMLNHKIYRYKDSNVLKGQQKAFDEIIDNQIHENSNKRKREELKADNIHI